MKSTSALTKTLNYTAISDATLLVFKHTLITLIFEIRHILKLTDHSGSKSPRTLPNKFSDLSSIFQSFKFLKSYSYNNINSQLDATKIILLTISISSICFGR